MKSATIKDPINGAAGNDGADENDNENFYECLPRFVTDQPIEAVGEDLHPVERIVEYGGKQFVLTIIPAKVIVNAEDNNGFESRSRLPGDSERKMEEALRLLADPKNINYDADENVLTTGFSQLSAVISWLDEDEDEDGRNDEIKDRNDEIKDKNRTPTEITPSRVEIVLSTLCNIYYVLKRGEREFYFRSIEMIRRIEKDGEIYFVIYFTQVFFNSDLLRRFLWD